MKKISLLSVFMVFLQVFSSQAQKSTVINEIVAVVGNKIILTSDIEERLTQMLMRGEATDNLASRCMILEELLYQKMLVYRAGVDSVTVSADQVESELERRIRYFIAQFETQEKMEEYLGKTIPEIKKEFRQAIEEQLLVQQMQDKITGNLKVTPGEVRAYYARIPKDSLPFIPSEIEIAQIIVKPEISEEEKRKVRDKLNKIRNDILRGSSFALKAKVYSMDRASAEQGGELGFLTREDLVPEFAAVAFRLKPGEVSEIVETDFGFHIIELIEKRGELANFRHILIRPEISDEAYLKAEDKIDSVYRMIGTNDTLTFEKLAELHSDDEETRFNGGKMFNFQSGSGKFKIDQLDLFTYREISGLNPGEVSKVHLHDTPTGTKAFRILKLISRSQPHVADLKTDYQVIQAAALAEKESEAISRYINKMKHTMYIRINDEYKTCNFKNDWEVKIKK
jgi:peptidyl-prolyl cis-trans isomerase SurA